MTDNMMATDRWRLIENDELLELKKLAPGYVMPGPRFKLQQWYESASGQGEWRDSLDPSKLPADVSPEKSPSANNPPGSQETEK